MSNEELAKAIEAAHMFTRSCSKEEAAHHRWLQHLTDLLTEQLKRARGGML